MIKVGVFIDQSDDIVSINMWCILGGYLLQNGIKSFFNFLKRNSKIIFLLQLWDSVYRLEEDDPRNKGAWQKLTIIVCALILLILI